MFNPKPEVYSTLKGLGYYCAQERQATFSELPAITFTVGANAPVYELGKSVAGADVEVVVDIWANDSVTLSRIAGEVEAAMREIDYLCNWSSDIPNPEGALFHYQMRFGGVKA